MAQTPNFDDMICFRLFYWI